jgi:hypothetical protein
MTTLRLFPIRLAAPRGFELPRWGWSALATLRRQARKALSRYRPERHYMRGPGPACMAKRQRRLVPTTLNRD